MSVESQTFGFTVKIYVHEILFAGDVNEFGLGINPDIRPRRLCLHTI